MQGVKNLKLWVIGGLLLVTLLVTILVASRTPPVPESQPSPQGTVGAPASPETQAGTPAPRQGTPRSQGAASRTLLAPAVDTEWVLGESHEIRWSRDAGLTGGIELIDAESKKSVGWIHSSLGARQTSFAWDTQSIFLSRSNPQKKDIGTGRYIARVVFDGPVPALQSPPFSIIYAAQVKIPMRSVTIENFVFAPSSLAVKRGERVVFTNRDGALHQIRIANLSPYTLTSGESFTFDTTALTVGTYELYSDLYPSMRGTLLVQ